MSNNIEPLNKSNDRFMTIFALSCLNDKKNETACPSAELLTAFFEGHLKGQEYDTIKAHIKHCSKCFHISLAVDSCVQPGIFGKIFLFIRYQLSRLTNIIQYWFLMIVDWYDNVKQFFSRPVFIQLPQLALVNRKPVYLIPVFMIFMIGLFCLWPEFQTLDIQLQKSYDMISQKGLINDQFILPGKWSAETYGLSDSNYYPENIAFGAGLWEGFQELSKPGEKFPAIPEWICTHWEGNKWTESQWKTYFFLGKWCYIQRYVCLTQTSASQNFWANQTAVLNQLVDYIQQDADTSQNDIHRTIIRSLKNVQDELKLIHKDMRVHKDKIALEIYGLIRYLCPPQQAVYQ
jgi:hypothetical protein